MKLTADNVSGLSAPPGKSDHIEWDEDLPGFGIRLRGDRKSWVVQYRVGLQQRRESLGDVRKVKIGDARKIAQQRFAAAELGRDPAAERARAKAVTKASKLTLQVAAVRYLAAKGDVQRARTYGQAKLHLLGPHWKPLANRPMEAITRSEIAARLQEIVVEHGRTAAARARGNLSALYGWAVREGLCDSNPAIHTNDPAEGIQPRERVLTDRELAMVWGACQDDDFGRIVRLLILTGCRREEIGGLRWSEIDFDSGVMAVPGERTKNHRTLTLPLSAAALDLLRSAPRREGRAFVFGSRGASFSAWSYSTIALNNRIAAAAGAPLAGWRLHDLRRTFRTGLGKLGVAPHIAELAINHARKGIEATYDRYRYESEIKTVLALWASHVLAAVEGHERKVVPLRGA